MKAGVLIIGLLLAVTGVAAPREVLLGTSILPPYQTEHDGQLAGRSVDIMNCVFQQLAYGWRGRIMPWPRARIQMETGELDGFFSAMPDSRVEQYARHSVPLALEKWYWFARTDAILEHDDFPEQARIGALRDSATLLWLRDREIEPETVVASPQQLLKLVSTNRIDAFLSDLRVARHATRELGIDADAFPHRFHQYIPLVAWFSHAFLAARPEFLVNFNQRVHACIGDTFDISAYERQRLARLARERIQPWTRNERLLTSLRRINAQRASLDRSAIQRLDEQWRAGRESGDSRLIDSLRESRLSRLLRRQETAADGLFREIIVTGKHGLNAGISRTTSDYWQGDETKFRAARDTTDGEPVIEDIRYDESTRRFQVHVSLPIRDPDTGAFLGVVTAGVDIQQALAAE